VAAASHQHAASRHYRELRARPLPQRPPRAKSNSDYLAPVRSSKLSTHCDTTNSYRGPGAAVVVSSFLSGRSGRKLHMNVFIQQNSRLKRLALLGLGGCGSAACPQARSAAGGVKFLAFLTRAR
jgi:hypothetical protein